MLTYTKPVTTTAPPTAPATGDDFTTTALGPQWAWAANPRADWWALLPGRGLRLTCVPSEVAGDLRQLPNLLGHRLPADRFRATTTLRLTDAVVGARTGLTILGDSYAWVGLERTRHGVALVHRTAAAGAPEEDAEPPVPVPVLDDGSWASASVGVEIDQTGLCQFLASTRSDPPRPIGPPVTATQGRWVGATLGLFAAAPPTTGAAGTAQVTALRVTALPVDRTGDHQQPR